MAVGAFPSCMDVVEVIVVRMVPSGSGRTKISMVKLYISMVHGGIFLSVIKWEDENVLLFFP